MERAARNWPARQRYIDLLRGQAEGLDLPVQISAANGQGSLDGLTHLIGHGPYARPVLGRERTDATQDGSEIALLAQVLDLERLERHRISCGRNLRQGACLQASQIGAQAFEIHAAVPHLGAGAAPVAGSADCDLLLPRI